jgi:uncharacterized protein (TIGR02265 family)
MVEGLIRALGEKLDERAHQKFAELGLPLKGKLQPAYPREAWMRACLFAGELLNPMATPLEQRRLLGHRFVDGYSETLVGKALMASMRVLGTRRALARLEKSFRTGNNYSKAELREEPDGLFMVVSNAPYPEWYQGMIESACRVTGAKEYRVNAIKRDGDTTTFRIEYR